MAMQPSLPCAKAKATPLVKGPPCGSTSTRYEPDFWNGDAVLGVSIS